MAVLYITEFSHNAVQLGGQVGFLEQPPLAEQNVAIGVGSVQSAALNASTNYVELHTDAICSIKIGTNPTAVATAARMAAGETRRYGVPAGTSFKVAVITNT